MRQLRRGIARRHQATEGEIAQGRGRDTATVTEFRKQNKNANRHTERGLKLLSESIDRDGWIGALTVAADGETFDGSARLVTAQQDSQLEPIVIDSDGTRPVIVRRTDIATADDPKAKRLGVMANHVTATDWEPDAAILAEIANDDAVIAALAKEDARLAELLRGEAKPEPKDAGELVDKAAELQAKWQVKRGDVWQVGKHRVMCGDSTNAADVARLMQGEKAGLVATSPPYFNQREYAQWKTYEDYLSFVALVVGETSRNLLDDAVFAVNIGSDEPARRWMPSDWWCILRDSDSSWLYRECIAWVKAAAVWNVPRSMHIENGHYFPAQRWEVILVVSRGKHPKFEVSDRDAVREFDENVWQIAVVSGNEQKALGHNAPFPIEIPRRLIMAYTTKGKMVYEPFLGSGSTIAACEQTGRIGRGMEISEKYCAVTLERLCGLGLTPQRITRDG